ncbi:MAG: hypothetical protein HOJ35_03135 [Bdellovibrionales bacterium]|jgi:hypothetical protein|nr:hypothetical protein [Bdellovibrionales bacterium]
MKKILTLLVLISLIQSSYLTAGENSGLGGGTKIILSKDARNILVDKIKILKFKDETEAKISELKDIVLKSKESKIDYVVLKDFSVKFPDQVTKIILKD